MTRKNKKKNRHERRRANKDRRLLIEVSRKLKGLPVYAIGEMVEYDSIVAGQNLTKPMPLRVEQVFYAEERVRVRDEDHNVHTVRMYLIKKV